MHDFLDMLIDRGIPLAFVGGSDQSKLKDQIDEKCTIFGV